MYRRLFLRRPKMNQLAIRCHQLEAALTTRYGLFIFHP